MIACGMASGQTNAEDTCVKYLYIQGDNVNVRAEPNTKANVVMQLNKTENCKILERGSKETINNKADYWYKVKCKNNTGWVFGAFTSLKLEGRKTMIMTFDGCDMGDFIHTYFKDDTGKRWDFYTSFNNYCNYSFCTDSIDKSGNYAIVGAKNYMGKKFELVLNDLYKESCVDWPECKTFTIILETSIIYLKQID
jgi:hypothetical protein